MTDESTCNPTMLEELFTLSYNFEEPVGIRIGDRFITAVVEELDTRQVKMSGEWYRLRDIAGIIS